MQDCSTLFLEEGLLVNQDLVVLASLLGELLSLPLETGLTDGPSQHLCGFWGSELQSLTLPSTLTAEPSSQLCFIL